MIKALSDNVAGHRSKYNMTVAGLPPEEVGPSYVGGGDPVLTGFREIELIRTYGTISDANVIDIGCGIGRLTQHLVPKAIASYLGTDIIPEILADAEATAAGDDRFRFAISEECVIPAEDESATIVVAFSVLTHLMDEESFDYVKEGFRVLKLGGLALYSFLDFSIPDQMANFLRHAEQHRHGHGDILKFTSPNVLEAIARHVGFHSVEFLPGNRRLRFTGAPSHLVDVKTLGDTFTFEQSLCIMRK